jgi:O-succinylbenzoate synthase
VRARFPELPLMVDANSSYRADDAPRLRALDPFGLLMIEQPLGWDDLVEHARLQRELRTPLCLDESLRSPARVRAALELGACRSVNLKVGRVGGFGAALEIEALCRARGVALWCGGMLESGIGRLANVHLQSLRGFTLPGDTSDGRRYFDEDLVDPPVTVAPDGTLEVPRAPGIGHALVFARLERATRFREAFRR